MRRPVGQSDRTRGGSKAAPAPTAAGSAPGGWDSLPAELLELIASRLSFQQRLRLCEVNRHWRAVMLASGLWNRVQLDWPCSDDLPHRDEQRAASMLAYCASRAQGIRELVLSFEEAEQWGDVACLLGTVGPRLRRLEMAAGSSACELSERNTAFLWQLRGLTSLDLESCLDCLPRAVSRLTSLRELLVTRDDNSLGELNIPEQIAELRQLTRLELVRCCGALPASVSRLTRLRLLNLDGNDALGGPLEFAALRLVLGALTNLVELDLADCNLPDVPSDALSRLTGLTTLTLSGAFGGRDFGLGWETKLECLSCLTSLCWLDLGGNEMGALPRSLTGLTSLETLDCGMAPLSGATGVPDGPYLEGLHHLNIRGAAFTSLPQHLTRAQQLTFLGLSCCHDLWMCGSMAESVVGRLRSLATLTLCDQMMHSVDSARCMHALGRLLPDLEIVTHDEAEDEEEEEEEEEEESIFDSEEDEDSSEYNSEEDESEPYTDEEDEDEEWESEWEEEYHGGSGAADGAAAASEGGAGDGSDGEAEAAGSGAEGASGGSSSGGGGIAMSSLPWFEASARLGDYY
ncbi:small GTP-binding isoform A [Chlorella sorokiniana]|uniref:Small GTP-binding isoform A n=1 Tax=Chlorella sorokiniana TaxID=3076 RepID=A0A2P6U074_CHLSO|nr:small GTP-binding isoform A [Chlorella sorokiniana]|eukprot:PRW59706.1 small GTP-binding isoform A [Chlorella sorokiniana]